jgi:oxalate decarboxylase/phosphoglucose isomerase-like protein (cupin superfamily)
MTLKPGGWSREITKRELPVSDTFAMVDMNLSPSVREMHSHQQSEFGYVLVGGARVTAIDEMGRTFIADCAPGEGWIFPKNIPHSIQGLHEGCEFLMLFDKGSYSEEHTFSISELFSHLPRPRHAGLPNQPLALRRGAAHLQARALPRGAADGGGRERPHPRSRQFPRLHHRRRRAGDVGYVPVGGFHYVQNIGKEKLVFLEFFNSSHFADVSLAQWMANTPREVVRSILNLPDAFLDSLKKESCPVVRYPDFAFPPAEHTPQNVRYFKDFDYVKREVKPSPAIKGEQR